MNGQRTLRGHLAALLTIFIWGMTFISTKVLLKGFTPVEILVLRFLLGYAALWVMFPRRLRFSGLRRELLFAGAGLCGLTLYYLFENIALTYTLASNVGVIVSVSPFFTALLAHFTLDGEKLHARFFVGFAAAIAGIFLIDFNGSFVLRLNPLGDFLALLAAMIWAVYSVLMKKISLLGLPTIGCTRRIFFYGLVFMAPAVWVSPFRFSAGSLFNPVMLLNLLFLGVGASAMCFVTWNWSVGVLGAVKTSVYIYLIPIITIAASVLLLGEQLTWVALLGAALTMAGLFLSEKIRLPRLKSAVIQKQECTEAEEKSA